MGIHEARDLGGSFTRQLSSQHAIKDTNNEHKYRGASERGSRTGESRGKQERSLPVEGDGPTPDQAIAVLAPIPPRSARNVILDVLWRLDCSKD